MLIKFCEFGQSLGTRNLGNTIRKNIESNISIGNEVIFDLKNVDLLSNSFADECFGKLILKFDIKEIKSKTKFINVNNINRTIILKAINDRIV